MYLTNPPTPIPFPLNVSLPPDAAHYPHPPLLYASANVTDNCPGATSANNHASSTYPVGVTTVIWTATDASGNTSTCAQTVTVFDNQPPAITCPANVSVSADAGQCSASAVVIGSATVTDNCPGATSSSDERRAANQGGFTRVTWTATEASGNTYTCAQTVTVIDNQPPAITCTANVS